jgi:hypothetical protein
MSQQNNCDDSSSSAKEFQSNMTDLLEKMGASQQCKQKADTFFASGSSSSGSNLQSGETSNRLDSSLDTSVEGNTTNVVIDLPSAGFGLVDAGGVDTQNVYTASDTKSNLSTEQKASQLNLTQQQATAFNNGASAMAAEGCGTVVLNSTRISNMKKKMNCFLKSRKYNSSVSVSNGNDIQIKQIPTPLPDCVALLKAGATDKMIERCFESVNKITEANKNSKMNIKNAKFTQSASTTVKTQIELTDSDKKILVDMQKEIANNIVEGKLTSDNRLDALPQSAKDIITRDTAIEEICTTKSIDDKTSNTDIKMVGGNTIIIEYVGDLDAENLVIDQNSVATMITEILFKDSVEAGITASKEIEDSFKKETGMSLSSAGQDLAKIADSGNKGNVDAITAGQAGVNTAASNQVAVDAGKLAAGIVDINKSNQGVLEEKGEADKKVIEQTGDNAEDLTREQGKVVTDIINANNWGMWGGIIGGVLFLILIVILWKFGKKFFKSDNADTPTTESSSNQV